MESKRTKRTKRTVAALTLVLVGLVGWVSVSHSMALFDVGVIAGAVGLTTFGTIRIADGQLIDAVQVNLADGTMVIDLFTGVPSQTVPMFTTPSLVLMGLGVLFIATGLAVRAELIPIADVLGESETRPEVEFNETVSSNEPAGSTEPVGSNDGFGSTDPVGSNEPAGPTDPVGSNEPAGPTDPVGSNDGFGSTESAGPAEPADEVDPWEGGVTIGGTNDTNREPTVADQDPPHDQNPTHTDQNPPHTDQNPTHTDHDPAHTGDVQEYDETDYEGVTISQPDEQDDNGDDRP